MKEPHRTFSAGFGAGIFAYIATVLIAGPPSYDWAIGIAAFVVYVLMLLDNVRESRGRAEDA